MLDFDVVIIGGGPGGLSAALVLGRARRRVLVCDSGRYRNHASREFHGYLTRDGIPPAEFRRIARAEIARYETVEIREVEVRAASQQRGGFALELSSGAPVRTRKLILATGVVDELPNVDGAAEIYGTHLFHCPYCDGWERRGQPLAVYGRGDRRGAGLALELTLWSNNLVLCTDGPDELSPQIVDRLRRFAIAVRQESIRRFERRGGDVRITFSSGDAVDVVGIFFNTRRRQASDLAQRLGCEDFAEEGCRVDNKVGKTHVPGLYIVGDASRDVLQAVVAAGEGSEAAIAVNTELLRDDEIL